MATLAHIFSTFTGKIVIGCAVTGLTMIVFLYKIKMEGDDE